MANWLNTLSVHVCVARMCRLWGKRFFFFFSLRARLIPMQTHAGKGETHIQMANENCHDFVWERKKNAHTIWHNQRERSRKNGAANAMPKQKRCFYSARFRVRASPRVCVRLNARVRDVTVQFSTCIHNYAIIRFPRSTFFVSLPLLHYTSHSARNAKCGRRRDVAATKQQIHMCKCDSRAFSSLVAAPFLCCRQWRHATNRLMTVKWHKNVFDVFLYFLAAESLGPENVRLINVSCCRNDWRNFRIFA